MAYWTNNYVYQSFLSLFSIKSSIYLIVIDLKDRNRDHWVDLLHNIQHLTIFDDIWTNIFFYNKIRIKGEITISGNNLSRVIIGFIHFTYIISICSLKWWKKHVRTMKIKVMADLNQNNDFFYKNLILNLRVGISNCCNSVMNYWLFGHIS